MPRGHERAEALAGRAAEVDVDRAVGQALAAVAPGHLVAEHRADGAVDVADRQLDAAPASPSLERRCGQLDEQLLVERLGRGRGPAAPSWCSVWP